MSNFSYNDGLKPAGRTPRLWIVTATGAVVAFEGKGIDGVCAVVKETYQKNGKWSNTTYDLALADGATPCILLAKMHEKTWPENTRQDAYERFCTQYFCKPSFASFGRALERDYPETHARMIAVESQLETIRKPDVRSTEYETLAADTSVRRSFAITLGLRRGYTQDEAIADRASVVAEIERYLKQCAASSQPFFTGILSETRTVIYAWPGSTPANAASENEPVVVYSGEVSVLYCASIGDEQAKTILNRMASRLGSFLGQTRVYVVYREEAWVLQAVAVPATGGN